MVVEPSDNMTDTIKKNKSSAPDVTREIYGGVLNFDAAGHYPGLELLNLVYGTVSDKLLPQEDEIRVLRTSHDFGRRLVWDEEFKTDERYASVLLNQTEAADTLKSLLHCLQLDNPNGKDVPSWSKGYFFPYTRSMIHWDGQLRAGNKVSLERRYLRGGGALCYKVLRFDPNTNRLKSIRDGFNNLYKTTSETPLEILAKFLSEQSENDREPNLDQIEFSSSSWDDELEDLYRNGVQCLLSQEMVTSVSKVRSLMGWTSLWLVVMQHRRSFLKLEKVPPALVFDCGGGNGQLRRAAVKSLKDSMQAIIEAVDCTASLVNGQKNNIRSFFWATAAAVGLLNAWRGRRHFTFAVDTLEMITLATVPSGEEIPFDRFVSEILYEKLGFVVSRQAAEKADLLSTIDASVFEENEKQLAVQMMAAGLLTQYSDATQMVSARGLS